MQLPSPKQILAQNGHSRSFKVIYFGIIEEPIAQHRLNGHSRSFKVIYFGIIEEPIAQHRLINVTLEA